MGAYQLDVFLHLLVSVLLTGYALFWAVMARALARHHAPAERATLLDAVHRSRWPHVVVPWSLRLPLPLVGWVLILALALTGILAATLGGSIAAGGIGGAFSAVFAIKIALFVALVAGHAVLTRRPHPSAIYANLGLVLAILVASVLALR